MNNNTIEIRHIIFMKQHEKTHHIEHSGRKKSRIETIYLRVTSVGRFLAFPQAYYLEDLNSIQQKCKFNLIKAQEHVFQLASNIWIISSPIDFSTTIKCPSTFTTIAIRSSATITVPPGCQVNLREHVIQPDTATTDSDLETIHYEWSWDSNMLFSYAYLV